MPIILIFHKYGSHSEPHTLLFALILLVVYHYCLSTYHSQREKHILMALNSLHPNKAPGSDGTSTLFYQYFFRHGRFPQGFNDSFVILIPKTTHFSTSNHIRPIALCNTLYKIFSKFLVLWLRPLLQNLI